MRSRSLASACSLAWATRSRSAAARSLRAAIACPSNTAAKPQPNAIACWSPNPSPITPPSAATAARPAAPNQATRRGAVYPSASSDSGPARCDGPPS